MALTDTAQTATLLDATTGEAVNPPAPKTSGDTHQSSGPSGPDPTGLRGTLERNAAKVQASLAGAAEAAAAETNATKKVSRETTEGERGPDGKFLPKAADAATKPEPDEPPSTWRAETKALWKEIDVKFGPEQGKLLKEELRKREGDFRKGIADKDAEVSTIKGFHGELSPLVAKYEHLYKPQGITAAKAIENLLQLNENFRRDPAGAIKWLAQTAGLDLSKLASGAGQEGTQQVDPQLQPVMQLVHGLQSELSQIKTGWQSQITTQAAAEVQSVIDEKGADGQPVRPHFDAVFQDIQAETQRLIAQNPAISPREATIKAYDVAVWRNPEIRAKMIESMTAKNQSTEDAAARARAAEAAARTVRGGPPNHLNGATNPTDLRGTLTAKVGALYGGGSRF